MSVLVVVEHFELDPPEGSVSSAYLGGGLGARPKPDLLRYSHRSYGHRVGIFRVLDAIEAVGATASVALDVISAEKYPWLVNHLKARGVEFVAHGISVNRMISSRMSEYEERAYIRFTLDRLEELTGVRPLGWMGPEHGESASTPRLLAAEGIEYVCDWPNDEQPYRMTVPQGDLISLPPMIEYDDNFALSHRKMPINGYEDMVISGVDQLLADGAESARYLLLTVRPWLIGQPFRIGSLESILQHASTAGAWFATTGEIASEYRNSQ